MKHHRKTDWVALSIRLTGVLLMIWGLLIIVVPILLPDVIVWSPNAGVIIDLADDPDWEELNALGVDLHLRVPVSSPEASISSFILHPSRPNPRGTILVFHGHRDTKLMQLGIGKRLAELGYRAVLVDHRGHGLSTGDYVSFGVWEANDMMTLLDRLEEQHLLVKPVGVIGFSYGGSVAIQLGAKDDRIASIVSVSTFSSLREVVEDYVGCFLPFVAPMISEEQFDKAVAKAGEIGGFDPTKANTKEAVGKLNVPLLLMHGEDDWRIPVEHAERLYAAARSDCELITVPNKGHGNILKGKEGEVLLGQGFAWLEESLASF